MIYTITFNPSLDLYLDIDDFKIGKTNRTLSESYHLGGKGLNVSEVLSTLKTANTAVTYVGGFVGREIKTLLDAKPYQKIVFEKSDGLSRINIKFASTEINQSGLYLNDGDLAALYDLLSDLKPSDLLVISGKLNAKEDTLKELLAYLHKRGFPYVLDSYDINADDLQYSPFLIKPNLTELESLSRQTLKNESEIIDAIFDLRARGAVNIIASLGNKGSLALLKGQLYKEEPPTLRVRNTVGAGDSLIAGFLAGHHYTNDLLKAYHLGIACAYANVTSDGLPRIEDIKEYYPKVMITELDR